jgi:hypothetical protein
MVAAKATIANAPTRMRRIVLLHGVCGTTTRREIGNAPDLTEAKCPAIRLGACKCRRAKATGSLYLGLDCPLEQSHRKNDCIKRDRRRRRGQMPAQSRSATSHATYGHAEPGDLLGCDRQYLDNCSGDRGLCLLNHRASRLRWWRGMSELKRRRIISTPCGEQRAAVVQQQHGQQDV